MVDIIRPNFGTVWAASGEKLSPTEIKIQGGWIQEMMPYQYQNFLQNRVDNAITYILQKGVPEWDASQEYTANKSVVTYSGQLYMALTTNTNVPPTVTSSWKKLTVTLGVNGALPVAFGGTGATNAADARTNLGIGNTATTTLPVSNGVVVKLSDNSLIARTIVGTAGYITVTNSDGVGGNPTINIGENVAKTDADAAWTTNTSIRLPAGSTAEQGAATPGRIRFNLETNEFHGAYAGGWSILSKPATAAETPIVDAGGYYSSSNVEGALQEIASIEEDGVTQPLKTYVKNTKTYLKKAVLQYPTYADILSSVPRQQAGQIVESIYDRMRYDIDSSGEPTNERPITQFIDYGKVETYNGRGTRLRVEDATGVYWWVRRGSAASNGGTVLKDALGRSWEREFSGNAKAAWWGVSSGASDNGPLLSAALAAMSGLDSPIVEMPCGVLHFKTSAKVPERATLVAPKTAWAYSDAGNRFRTTLYVTPDHSIPTDEGVLDCTGSRQTFIEGLYFDLQPGIAGIRYGKKSGSTAPARGNHVLQHCNFLRGKYGVVAHDAGLTRFFEISFAKQSHNGVKGIEALSDSTWLNLYFADIGGNEATLSDESVGAAVALPEYAGVTLIGGKMEWCRVGLYMQGTQGVRMVGYWMDNNTKAHVFFDGASFAGISIANTFSATTFTGGGHLDPNGAAVLIRTGGYFASFVFDNSCVFRAANEMLQPAPTDPTYGPKLAAVSVIGANASVRFSADAKDCSKQFAVYADGLSVLLDDSSGNMPNVIASGATMNGNIYDCGTPLKGINYRISGNNAEAASNGIGVGQPYVTNTAILKVRLI